MRDYNLSQSQKEEIFKKHIVLPNPDFLSVVSEQVLEEEGSQRKKNGNKFNKEREFVRLLEELIYTPNLY